MAENIEVVLTLKDRGFSRTAGQAKGALGGLAGGAVGATAGFARMVPVLAAAAAAAAALYAGFNQVKQALSVSQQFEDINVVLSNLTGSAAKGQAALDQLAKAAETLPYSFEELAAATPALATISPTLEDLQRNTQLAADLAANFGISFQDAAGQLQRAFSGGIAAADIFREKGVKSAAGFQEGVTYSVEETRQKLIEFGASIEGVSQKLNDTLTGSISQAGDRLTIFQKAMGDAFRPELKAGIDILVQAFDDNRDVITEFAQSVGQGLVSAFFAAGDAIALIIDIVVSLGRTFKMVFDGIKQVVGPFFQEFFDIAVRVLGFIIEQVAYVGIGFGKLLEMLPGVDATVTDFFQNVQNAARNAREQGLDVFSEGAEGLFEGITFSTEYRDAFNQFEAKVIETAGLTREQAAAVKEAATELTDTTIQIAENFGKTTETVEKFADMLKRLKEDFATVDTLEEYNAQLVILDQMLRDGKISAEEFARAKAALDKAFEENAPLYGTFVKVMEDAASTLSTGLVDAMMGTADFMDVMKDTFKRAITQMIADAFRLKIIEPILSGIFGGSFSGGKYTPGSGGILSSIFSGIFKADGGPVLSNKPYIVGEEGPELFVPGNSGTIVPNGSMGGGGAVTYNINAVDARSFKQLVAQDPEFIYSVTQAGRRRLPA
jgi:hypothetical protein